MSNFTLRSRKIDADRPLLIVHGPLPNEETEKNERNGFISREDTEFLMGMRKQEQEVWIAADFVLYRQTTLRRERLNKN
jgi:hypothetical protein